MGASEIISWRLGSCRCEIVISVDDHIGKLAWELLKSNREARMGGSEIKSALAGSPRALTSFLFARLNTMGLYKSNLLVTGDLHIRIRMGGCPNFYGSFTFLLDKQSIFGFSRMCKCRMKGKF
ncbi:hypothetical protein KP509_18G047400 [Ceratopteris richardii]|uniref:Uncharacterized protein n=1 Tax=Ceratopteris richardii TaxID=49495 RepID=A0A8T2SRC8_CERRI|nr:hypothetical protein KP509_18G047400 [Ceratopteris richardii]